MTEGWLLHHLSETPEIVSNYNCIIVDEAHERNIETYLLLTLLRKMVQDQVFPLKVIGMSATIDPAQFRECFKDCSVIDCPGKLYPVEEFYRPPSKSTSDESKCIGAIDIGNAISVLFEVLHNFVGEPGDCLIFLSGSAQIHQCVDQINARAKIEEMPFVFACPLYVQIKESDIDAATDTNHRIGVLKTTDGKYERIRKIICCTNIAQTSLTIDGVHFFIEGGYAKKSDIAIVHAAKVW